MLLRFINAAMISQSTEQLYRFSLKMQRVFEYLRLTGNT